MLLNDAGYVSFPDKKYHFYIKDHQGNVRVVADAEGNVEEVNDYYPFGGLMSNATGNDFQKYKYNGKELDRKAGLNWYDYGARFYDPGIGRWHVVDPMLEKYYPYSPYGYCLGNPIIYRDKEGKFITNIIGAFVGGVVDLGTQVVANLATGNGAFDNIDWISVGASTVEGAVTSGLSAGKTLAVKAGTTLVKSTINGIKSGDSVTDIGVDATQNIVKDALFGKAGGIVDKGVKKALPKVGQKLEKMGNRTVLSKTKATEMVKSMSGNKLDTKTSRSIATSKGGVVDASKELGKAIQNVPKNITEEILNLKDKINEFEMEK